MELTIEKRTQEDKTAIYSNKKGGGIMLTPPIDESYWEYRVKLHEDQAIIGFPKFMTIGIGFAIEEDWNTNLPYTCEAEKIASHIWCNRKYKNITKANVIKAIQLIQQAVATDKQKENRDALADIYEDLKVDDKQVIDEACTCGHNRSEHFNHFSIGHGGCSRCNCGQFTWIGWVTE